MAIDKEKRRLGETITSLGDLRTATHALSNDLQIYVSGLDEVSSLFEVTDLFVVLAKRKDEMPYLILKVS